jgi:GYF domain 2
VNYFISRDGQTYGPYTLAELQRYTASGEVLLTDLATSDGLPEPVQVAQIVGTIAAPTAFNVATRPTSEADVYPDPPNLHWGLVLLFGIISWGLFSIVWDIVQAAWLRRIEPESKALYIYIGGAITLGLIFYSSILGALNHTPPGYVGLLQLVYYTVLLAGRFSFRSSMEEHFNGPEPMGLGLSGVMTFFFGGIYFQYHINDIVRRKAVDRLYAMSN